MVRYTAHARQQLQQALSSSSSRSYHPYESTHLSAMALWWRSVASVRSRACSAQLMALPVPAEGMLLTQIPSPVACIQKKCMLAYFMLNKAGGTLAGGLRSRRAGAPAGLGQ